MKKSIFILPIIVFCVLTGGIVIHNKNKNRTNKSTKLENPQIKSNISIEEAIGKRRSIRSYKKEALTKKEISQLLWAAQGITNKKRSLRAAPSAGALYPLQIYLVASDVSGLPSGVYKYDNKKHMLIEIIKEDKKDELYKAALSQSCVKSGSANIVICADYEITSRKYGTKSKKYVHIEVGCVSENIYLQAVSLNCGTVFVGAFDEGKVQKIIGATSSEQPLCIMPVGRI